MRLKTILLVVLLMSPATMAWNKAGHMVVGALMYEELKASHPKTLEKLLAILHQHQDWDRFNKRLSAIAADDRDRYLVMIASRWPDDIRDVKELTQPSWHYVDYPIEAPGDTTPTQQPDVPNALTALTTETGVLKNPAAPAKDRAIAICWMEHLIGDIHMPLHAVSFYSPTLPKGDRGGNDEWVKIDASSRTVNLHALWDGLLTTTETYRDAANIATELRHRPEFQRDKLSEAQDLDPDHWAKESVDIAYRDAYINVTLKGGTKANGTLLPPGYGKASKAIAEKRVVLAGFRLADAMVATLGD